MKRNIPITTFDKWKLISALLHTGIGVFIGYLIWGG